MPHQDPTTEAPMRLPLLLPTGRDAVLVQQVLTELPEPEIEVVAHTSLASFLVHLNCDSGPFVVGAEALLPPSVRRLIAILDKQPEWSELPGIVFTTTEKVPPHIEALSDWRGIGLIRRPIRKSVFFNLMLTAIDARRRQFEIRDLLQELRQTNQQLSSRTELLQKLSLELTRAEDRERRRVAQMLHDDLQQMLVSARLHTELLSDDLPSGSESKTRQVYEILSTAIQSTRRLSHELNPVSVTDGSFRKGLKQLTTCAAEDYGFEVRLTCSELNEQLSEELKLFIYRSLQELLLNCAKYAKAKQVTLEVVQDGAFVRVSLTDDGVGFDPERLTISGGDMGGFGLFSIQERTNALEGSLTIDSKPGEGSRFLLKLPVDQTPVDGKVTAVQAGGDAERPTDVIAVMIAEDHAVMRQSLADLLDRHAGIEVVAQAADGEQAVALAQQFQPRVVLMDVSMPLVDGITATRRIVTEASQVAVVALSAAYDPGTRQRMLAAGAQDFLSKNVEADELIAAIRRHGRLVADAC